ncbi:hypothetical protein N7492_001664 [Penicillium capsulatum]|uniref:Threonylcarbamoyl-AMP synthase n=1 Tax=Penicillium capsulatum TaxID=69766 RepID=A0A9W9IRZ9_9EURO|nr:hypothetical protein N7492_001664 [Penicillium capsulatum]KAJ6129283.1 hypothetical protein N7512_002063 [Penicillium capsulatum]
MSAQSPINIEEDAKRVFEVLKNGGIAIIPANVGYGIIAVDPNALRRIYVTKQRQPHKRHAMMGSFALHQKIHNVDPRAAGLVRLLTVDLDLPAGVVAPYHSDHAMIRNLPPELLVESTIDGMMAMLVNGGRLQDEISRLATDAGLVVLGSSANLTGMGSKTVVEDIEADVKAAADIIIDYGRQKFQYPRASSTMIDFKNMNVLRYGACYDVIQDVASRFYGIKWPNEPGKAVLVSGHVSSCAMRKEFENEENGWLSK